MMRKTLLALAIVALSANAAADVIYTGGSASGQNATADFNFTSANSLTLTLTNTSNVTDISHILDDFHFLLSGTPTDVSFSSITASGGFETCTKDQRPPHTVRCSHDSSTNASGTWEIVASGGQIDMTSGANGSLHPYGIVNQSFITNAGMDGLTNAQHNPVLLGPVTFDITFAGLTQIPTISNVDFTFGTTPDHVGGTCTSGCGSTTSTTGTTNTTGTTSTTGTVPEPGTLSLLGLALVVIAARTKRRHS